MMKRLLRSQQGFTIVELMVAILIAGMITAVITSYLLAHIRSYNAAESIVDIQYEGQIALNQMSNMAIESTGVSHLMTKNDSGSLVSRLDWVDPVIINQVDEFIAFRLVDVDGSEEYHIYTMTANGVISYSQSDHDDLSAPTSYGVFARNVHHLSVTPGKNNLDGVILSTNETFESANSIDMELSLVNNDTRLIVKTQAKFRNK